MEKLATKRRRGRPKVESSAELDAIYTACKVYFRQDLNTIDKYNDVVFKRAIYFKVARELCTDSFSLIGGKVSRDHATVMHGVKVIFENDVKKDTKLNRQYEELIEICKEEIKKGFNVNKKKSDVLLHCNINLRQQIINLEDRINKIPLVVRQKYAI